MNIVLANSIGRDNRGYFIIHSPSRWSEGVKAKENWFAYYPWELAYTTALLKEKTKHSVKLIDGCLERLNFEYYLKKIAAEKPDYLILESATRMIEENLRLALEIKKMFGTKLILCGPHPTAYPKDMINHGVDFVCQGEYEETVLDIVCGKIPSDIKGLYPNQRRDLIDINRLPFPEDEDVSRLSYAIPGEPSSEYLEIQMYASRGCPLSCSYCVARNLYYAKPNFRPRQVENIVKEIIYLKNKYAVLEGIFFDEENHNGEKQFIMNLCNSLINEGLHALRYEAMCSLYNLDEEVMESMQKAGYYKLRFGIETASQKLARSINRRLDLKQTMATLKAARKIGLKMYGTFMFGLPQGSQKEEQKTIRLIEYLIKERYLHNVQISILTPQPTTPFFRLAEEQNYLTTHEYRQFDGGNTCIVSYPEYSKQEIQMMYSRALKIRDHLFFINNIKHNLVPWLKNSCRKKSKLLLIKKLFRRIIREIIFLMGRLKM